MRISALALALALLTGMQMQPVKPSARTADTQRQTIAEGMGPSAPPVIIKAIDHRLELAEGMGPSAPPVIIKIVAA